MKLLLLLLWTSLAAFEPILITPYPVVGYREVPIENQTLYLWYPVKADVVGTKSDSPIDVFKIAKDSEFQKVPAPLIILSHGYFGNPHMLSWLIRAFVHNGFIVAAVQHKDLEGGAIQLDYWKRASDIKSILDTLTKAPFDKIVDPNRIGLAGYSLGGMTALWLIGGKVTNLDNLVPSAEYAIQRDYSFAQDAINSINKDAWTKDYRDPRIKAAFIMAPAWTWVFDESSLKKVNIPVYLVAAEKDQILVSKNNAGKVHDLIPYSQYQLIPGKGGHYIFITAVGEANKNAMGRFSFVFEDDPEVDRAWIQSQVSEEAVRFFWSALNI
jgi:predicted dienelactone hydrolase